MGRDRRADAADRARHLHAFARCWPTRFALNSRLGLYTNFVNLLDMAGVAVPAGFPRQRHGFRRHPDRTLPSPTSPCSTSPRRYEAAGPMGDRPALDLEDGAERDKAGGGRRAPGRHAAALAAHFARRPHGGAHPHRPGLQAVRHGGLDAPKPALIHSAARARPSRSRVFELGLEAFGSFAAEVPPPLAIGTGHPGGRIEREGLRSRAARHDAGRGHHPPRRLARLHGLAEVGRPVPDPERVAERAAQGPRHRRMGQPALIDVEPLARCGSSFGASSPWSASARPNGRVAWPSASDEVRGAAPGMLATQ